MPLFKSLTEIMIPQIQADPKAVSITTTIKTCYTLKHVLYAKNMCLFYLLCSPIHNTLECIILILHLNSLSLVKHC